MLTTSKLMVIVLSIATVLLVVYYPILSYEPFRYSVVIEGGSTVSRSHVYTYEVEYGKPVSEFRVANYMNEILRPGLSVYADDPDEASVSLTKLVEMAKLRIPKRMWKKTQVRLIATSSGTSLLKKPVEEKFLQVTRRALKSSGFMFRDEWAYVMYGSEDVVNAWAVTNIALGSLDGDPLKTRNLVEVIEASGGNEALFSRGQVDYAVEAVRKPSESYQGKGYVFLTIMVMVLVVFFSRKM